MYHSGMVFFGLTAIIMVLVDLMLVIRCFKRKNDKAAFYLGMTGIGVIAATTAYTLSAVMQEHFWFSLFSSFVFIGIDFLSIFLNLFTVQIARNKNERLEHVLTAAMVGYASIEAIVFLINPFSEIAITYGSRNYPFACFDYVPKFFYDVHLIFVYLLILIALWRLVRKWLVVPRQYKTQYFMIIAGIILAVIINAAFLFSPAGSFLDRIDFGVIIYSMVFIITYVSRFIISANSMNEGLSVTLFDSMDQGIIVFDYNHQPIMMNQTFRHMFSGIDHIDSEVDFVTRSGFSSNVLKEMHDKDHYTIQFYLENEEKRTPVKCEIQKLTDNKKRYAGVYYIFTDISSESDMLTGFHNWDNFRHLAEIGEQTLLARESCVIFNLNNLAIINSTFGKEEGDRKMKEMAENMISCFPALSYFLRQEANLYVLCDSRDEILLGAYAEKVRNMCDSELQYAICMKNKDESVLTMAQQAAGILHMKKLLDEKSNYSHILNSLIRALKEADADTEAHVKRTQALGDALARELKLSEADRSRLKLLCVLHDIGKIGIPLEILNKPSRLSEKEYEIMKTHVEKGYQIAKSSAEFSVVADEVLYHHERWDGKGYPSGLSRESIPLLSRIVSVVDTYDSIVSDRVYRKGSTSQKALEELRKYAGLQFDPVIVATFVNLMNARPDLRYGKEMDAQDTTVPVDPDKEDMAQEENASGYSSRTVEVCNYFLNESNKIVQVDENFTKLTGYTQQDMDEGSYYQVDLIPPEERTYYLMLVEKNVRLNRATVNIEHHILRKDGSRVFVFCSGRLFYDAVNKEQRTQILVLNYSDTYAFRNLIDDESINSSIQRERWEAVYRNDSLTGLLSHAAFQNDVQMELLHDKSKILFLMIDLDKFKEYNDSFGHSAGDEYLIRVAKTIKGALRRDDFACRMGGDEFACALMFKKDASDDFMKLRARQIFQRISGELARSEKSTSLSMGAAISSPGSTFKDLYREADKYLYESKEKGRGKLTLGNEELVIRSAEMKDLSSVIRVEESCFPKAEAASSEALKERIEHAGRYFYLLIDHEGGRENIISMINGIATNEPDLKDAMYHDISFHDENGDWVMIFGVDTLPEKRNQGCATKLMNFVIADSRRQGKRGLVLTAKEGKIGFYTRFGFVNEGLSESSHGGVKWYQMRLTL